MSGVRLSTLSLEDVTRLAHRGLFAFAECVDHGLVFVSITRLDDGWRVTCADCASVIAPSSPVKFLTREAARGRGWHLTTDASVRRP